MPVVMEDSPSFVDQPGLGMPSTFPSVAAAMRVAPWSPALGEIHGEEPRPLLMSPSGRHRRAVVMGVVEASEFLEEGKFTSTNHGAGTEEFHRRFSIAAELDSGGGQTLLVSPKPRRTLGGNTSRGSCIGASVFGDGGAAGRSPLGPSEAGSLANSQALPVISMGALGGGSLAPPLDFSAAAAAATVSAGLPPTRRNLASRSVGGSGFARISGSSFTRISAASSVGEDDDCDWACGVCLDAADFIVMLPCKHKICGE